MLFQQNMKNTGLLDFYEYFKGEKINLIVHLYVVTKWNGEIAESEEMSPEWFDIDSIPYNQMFPDDKYWLPYILEDKKINAFFEFDQEWNLVSKKINEEKFDLL